MKYKITSDYCWFNHGDMIVRMYFINGVPYTFDEIPFITQNDPDIMSKADKNRDYDMEDLYNSTDYLIAEECHPCLFMLDLENPQDLLCN